MTLGEGHGALPIEQVIVFVPSEFDSFVGRLRQGRPTELGSGALKRLHTLLFDEASLFSCSFRLVMRRCLLLRVEHDHLHFLSNKEGSVEMHPFIGLLKQLEHFVAE